jgi:hypothetical protein
MCLFKIKYFPHISRKIQFLFSAAFDSLIKWYIFKETTFFNEKYSPKE